MDTKNAECQPGGWEEEEVLKLMAGAGDLAMKTFKNSKIDLKDDYSLVTEADVAVEDFLAHHLHHPSEGVYLIGEESAKNLTQDILDKAFSKVCFIVDPIDGTVNYANGLELWGVSLGRMVSGVLVDGAVYMPVLGDLYLTSGTEVVHYRRVHGKWINRRMLTPPKSVKMERALISITQQMVKKSTLQTRATIHAVAVAVYPLLKILEGSYKAYIGSLKLWDIAGVVPMLHRLGMDCRLLNGTTFGPAMNEGLVNLELGHPGCFTLKDRIFFGHPGEFEQVKKELGLT